MKVLILFVAWCILFVLYWPVALLALVLWAIAMTGFVTAYFLFSRRDISH